MNDLVVSAEAIVTAGDMDSIRSELTVTGSSVSGTIVDIPAGTNRKFEVFTYNADGVLTYSGSAVSVVPAGEVITLQITLYPQTGTGSVIIVGTFAENQPLGTALLKYDGIDDYVTIDTPVITTQVFTIEAWAYMAGPGGGTYHQNPIFDRRDSLTGQNDISNIILVAEAANNEAVLSFRSNDGELQEIRVPQAGYGDWHHYAGVVSASSIEFYIDGLLVGSIPNNQAGSYDSSIDYIEFGRHKYGNTIAGFFNGKIDEVRFWDRALSQAEIQAGMHSYLAGNEDGLISCWSFDEGEGQYTNDSIGGHSGLLGATDAPDADDPSWVIIE